ncbi:MAG: MBL fold metallo-hydrolase [Bacteroidia bacterium]
MRSNLINLQFPKSKNYIIFIVLCFGIVTCQNSKNENKAIENFGDSSKTYIVILGTLQDGGSPHIGCKKSCCKNLFTNPDPTRKVVSLGLGDAQNKKTWLIEATPDISTQLKFLKNISKFQETETGDGIFITHAHIGHYSGLMYLGKEAMWAKNVPIYAMPRMKTFLENNGPWSQLVSQQNILLKPLKEDSTIQLSSNFKITPFTVPHRDEFSETLGYKIEGPNKTALFIPDINKWDIWQRSIIAEIAKVDYAFIDATFYDGEEITSRKISEIPHPFVIESMELFKNLSAKEKSKIYFIHFNHTNPLIDAKSKQYELVRKLGFGVARFGDVIKM